MLKIMMDWSNLQIVLLGFKNEEFIPQRKPEDEY